MSYQFGAWRGSFVFVGVRVRVGEGVILLDVVDHEDAEVGNRCERPQRATLIHSTRLEVEPGSRARLGVVGGREEAVDWFLAEHPIAPKLGLSNTRRIGLFLSGPPLSAETEVRHRGDVSFERVRTRHLPRMPDWLRARAADLAPADIERARR